WFQFKDSFWSFPSGHAVTIAAVVSGLGVLIPKYFYYLLAIALLVAASRVMLCRHYLSDVMIGFYYSMLVVSVFAQYFRKNK
ncbi:MAG: phosphatase PAP2 family protein, partial [Legionella sp.]